MRTTIGILAFLSCPLWAQESLSIKDAVSLALHQHPAVAAAAAQVKAAETQTRQAQSGRLPKVTYQESYQRSDNPVFVFGSLLTQHQFAAANFQLDKLNQPDFLNNFQSQLTVDQVVYDGGQTRWAMRSAELGSGMAGQEDRRVRIALTAGVIRAYYGTLLAEENWKVAQAAIRSAEADLARAEEVRKAGMSTDADVLSIRVHLAAVREQEIRRRYDLDVARAALNEALGLPLDTPHSLSTTLQPAALPDVSLPDYEKKAIEVRPEVQQGRLSVQQAETQSSLARTAFLPQVVLHGAFEADRQRFVDRGGANWLLAASLKWNLFNGNADKARKEEAVYGLDRARAQERQLDSGIRLEVRRAYLDWKASQERLTVAAAAVAEADENLRIIKNRYQSGLTTVTELLRSETAVLEAKFRHLAAVHDQRLAAVSLESTAGTLSIDSEVLR